MKEKPAVKRIFEKLGSKKAHVEDEEYDHARKGRKKKNVQYKSVPGQPASISKVHSAPSGTDEDKATGHKHHHKHKESEEVMKGSATRRNHIKHKTGETIVREQDSGPVNVAALKKKHHTHK